ncbi:MAG TPA: hypothetical protein VFP66_14360 [Candidatus Limnocylindrales bacterium]|nr:hypothetical protein [Candidatus Limnocylindrales bacterium]
MTSEPVREPDADEPVVEPRTEHETPAQTEPVGSEDAVAATASGDDTTAGVEGQSTIEGQPTAEATATAMAEETALDVPAGGGDAAAVDTTVVPATPEATPTVEPTTETAKPRRRIVFIAGLRRVLAFALSVLLFAGGVAIGLRVFEMNRPAAPVTATIDSAATPPAVAQEFIRALATNDADALRSSLDQQPHKDITDEMTRFGIHRVQSIETLKTEIDGTRSATEIMMMAENADGLGFGINLVILVDGGKIEGFR